MVPASNEAASDGETSQKPKNAKPKVRDGIDIEMKKIEEDMIRKKAGDMTRPTSSQRAGEERSGTAQTPVASQVQVNRQQA